MALKSEYILNRIESLAELVGDQPTFIELKDELIDDIRASAMKSAGRGKELSAAKKLLKSSKKLCASSIYHAPHVVDGIQYFCNGCTLIALNDGYHFPFDAYKKEPNEKILDFARLISDALMDADRLIELDVAELATEIKKENVRKEAQLAYCFGDGLPLVDVWYLQVAIEMLGGDVECFVSSYNRPIYVTSPSGSAMVMPMKKGDNLKDCNQGFFPMVNKEAL
jgi:hypothetical protein